MQQDGMGPLATRLTLEEAEMLAARVGHVVRTAVSVDQNAVQEIKKEKDKKDDWLQTVAKIVEVGWTAFQFIRKH